MKSTFDWCVRNKFGYNFAISKTAPAYQKIETMISEGDISVNFFRYFKQHLANE